jgi:Sec-independent protein translocase protein TatA
MSTENCPKLAQLVEQLGEAINTQKRVAADEARTTDERVSADQQMSEALEAVRSHKAEHQCEMAETPESAA